LTLAQVGLYVGIYSLTVALCELPSGAIADTFGRKRTVMVSYALASVAKLVFLFAFDMSTFIAYAVVWGMARALGSGALEAWFIDGIQAHDPDADVQQALARAGTFSLIGLAAGTLAGSALPGLFNWLPADGTAVVSPLSTTVVASVVVGVMVITLTGLVVRDPRPPRTPVRPATGRPRRSTVRSVLQAAVSDVAATMRDSLALVRHNPRLRALLGAELAVGLALTATETFWQPFFADLMPSVTQEPSRASSAGAGGVLVTAGGADGTLLFGIVLAGCFGAGVIGNLIATPLAALARRRYARLASVFLVVQGALFLFLALQTNVLRATAFLWLTYMTRATWSSPHAALYNREVPAERRSVMLSVLSLAGFAGAFLGSVALGPLAEATRVASVWFVAGTCVAVSALSYLRLDGRTSPRSAASEPAAPMPHRGT
jgi:predicted MFS family arabinose efflux permease